MYFVLCLKLFPSILSFEKVARANSDINSIFSKILLLQKNKSYEL